jgi:hypothetical protein
VSRTDKTRPYEVKLRELPPNAVIFWRPEFGCGRSCKHCWGWHAKAEDRRVRQERKRQARDWQREYA